MSRWLVFCIGLLLSTASIAGPQAIVRAEIKPQEIAVGEIAELTITVLVPTWFARPPVYPNLELANAITRLPPDSSYPIQERQGGASWSGIVRTYEVMPLLAANYTFAGTRLSVAVADPGADATVQDIEIPAVTFRATVPQGAELLDPYLAGKDLEVSVNTVGPSTDLETGDALVVEYRAEIDGLSAIFLPSLAPELSLPGASIYADTPVVRDDKEKQGSRSETVTLVFEAGGTYTIPGLSLAYWDTQAQALATATAQALTVTVSGAPLAAATKEDEQTPWFKLALLLLALGLLAYAANRYLPVVVTAWRNAREQRRLSEPYAFQSAINALRNGTADESYRLILLWLERLTPGGISMREFARIAHDSELLQEFQQLGNSLYRDQQHSANLQQLAQQLTAARTTYLETLAARPNGALPPLNP